MSQIDIVIFLPLLFWFSFLYFIFYFFVYSYIIPLVFGVIRTRTWDTKIYFLNVMFNEDYITTLSIWNNGNTGMIPSHILFMYGIFSSFVFVIKECGVYIETKKS